MRGGVCQCPTGSAVHRPTTQASPNGHWIRGLCADGGNTMYAADLHFHLLPGVDDGPGDMSDSLELARAAVAAGTGTVVVTPHVRGDFVNDPLELPGRVDELRAALAAERIPLDLRCGGELGHDLVGVLAQHELEAIAQGPPAGRWLLVETPVRGLHRSLPRGHRRAAGPRLRGGDRPSRAHRGCRHGGRRCAAAGAGPGLGGPGERPVAHGPAWRGGPARRARPGARRPDRARGLRRSRAHAATVTAPGVRSAPARRHRSEGRRRGWCASGPGSCLRAVCRSTRRVAA